MSVFRLSRKLMLAKRANQPQESRVVSCAFGPERSAISTYQARLAEEFRRLGVRVQITTSEGPRVTRVALLATLFAADAVHVSSSPWYWPKGRTGFLRAAALHLFSRKRMCVVLHDVRALVESPLSERLVLSTHLALARSVVVHHAYERDRLDGLTHRRKLAVVPHFIEPRELPSRTESRRLLQVDDRRVVAVLGYIHPRKGHDIMLEVLPLVPDNVVLWCIGGASPGAEEYLDRLRLRARELSVDGRVCITGYLPEAELSQRIAATDVGVCPFRDASASGSLSTWLGSRKPVVGTDLPLLREHQALVPEAVFTFVRGSPSSLATSLVRALSVDVDPAAFDRLLADRALGRIASAHLELMRIGMDGGAPTRKAPQAGLPSP